VRGPPRLGSAVTPRCPRPTPRWRPTSRRSATQGRAPAPSPGDCPASGTLTGRPGIPVRPSTLGQLQVQLDAFRDYYNLIRPHRALNRRTPAEAYTGRPKASASGIPLVDGHFRVRHDKIDANGKLTLRHSSRLHHIGLGRRHAGTPVLVLFHDLHIRVLSTSGELLRDLTLDPTRDYQPQAQK
jgi:hypothetical protein